MKRAHLFAFSVAVGDVVLEKGRIAKRAEHESLQHLGRLLIGLRGQAQLCGRALVGGGVVTEESASCSSACSCVETAKPAASQRVRCCSSRTKQTTSTCYNMLDKVT